MKENSKPHFTLGRENRLPRPAPRARAQDAMDRLHGMAWQAAVRIEELLQDPRIPDSAKLPLVNLVLDRVYGKPEELLTVRSGARTAEESGERIRAAADRARVHSVGADNSNTRKTDTQSQETEEEEQHVSEINPGSDPL